MKSTIASSARRVELITGMVSVIIPLYNNEQYVKDSVNSVLQQSYQHFEVIIVDDGSTDGSLEQLSGIVDLVTIIKQENQGSAVARNMGLAAAKGEFIAFLDADDLWTPYKLALQVEFLNAHPDYQMVCGVDERISMEFRFTDIEAKPPCAPELLEKLSGKQFENLLFSCPYHINNLMLRKTALSNITFCPDLRRGQDLDFWFQLCSKYEVAYLNVLLSYYRENLSSISYKWQSVNVKLHILKTAIERVDSTNDVSKANIHKAFAHACSEYAYSARLHKKPFIAIKSYLHAIWYAPFNIAYTKGITACCLEAFKLKAYPRINKHVQ